MNNRRLPIIILTVIAFIVILALSSSLFYTISATEAYFTPLVPQSGRSFSTLSGKD